MKPTLTFLLAWTGFVGLVACSGPSAPPPTSTWNKPTLADAITAGGAANEVQAAFAGEVAVLVWAEGDRLYRAESTGSGFSTPEAVSTFGTQVYTYALAANSKGKAVLIWRENQRVKVALRSKGGWSGAVDIGLADPMKVAAAIDEAGNSWVARRIKVGNEYRIHVARWDGDSWRLSYETPSGNPAQSPTLAACDGRTLLAWEDPTGMGIIWVALYDGGWDSVQTFNPGFTNRRPLADLGPAGPAVTWETGGPGGNGIYLAREIGGRWETIFLGSDSQHPRVSSLSETLLAVWEQDQSGVSTVFAKHIGDTPARDQILSLPDTDASHPALAAFEDRALVAWVQANPGGGSQVLIAELGPEGWRLPTRDEALSPPGGSVAGLAPAVALGPDGKALVAWIQKDEGGTPRVYVAGRW